MCATVCVRAREKEGGRERRGREVVFVFDFTVCHYGLCVMCMCLTCVYSVCIDVLVCKRDITSQTPPNPLLLRLDSILTLSCLFSMGCVARGTENSLLLIIGLLLMTALLLFIILQNNFDSCPP